MSILLLQELTRNKKEKKKNYGNVKKKVPISDLMNNQENHRQVGINDC